MQHPTILSNNVPKEKNDFPKQGSIWFYPTLNMSSTRIFERDTTYDLRKDLFYNSMKVQKTPPRKIIGNDHHSLRRTSSETVSPTRNDPNEVTQEIFNQALQKRLIAIRDREMFLRKKEDNLKQRERAIKKREKRLAPHTSTGKHSRPIHRSVSSLDMSTLTVEPNDTIIMPTIAKIDASSMPRPNGFQCKVSFKSRKYLTSVDSENRPPPRQKEKEVTAMPSLQKTDISSRKSVVNAAPSTDAAIVKRKSIFGFLNFNSKKISSIENNLRPESPKNLPCDIVATKWTAETKRTAFEMLAIMNAKKKSKSTENDISIIDDIFVNDKILRHNRKRQSMIMLKRNR